MLDEAFEIFRLQYGNLRNEEDWFKLFHHLIEKSFGAKEEDSEERSKEILASVFGNELVNATILYFQSLCPVRFAFMDGQARMAAVHYYIRKIVPTMDGKALGLSSVYRNNPKVLRHWSLRKSAGKDKLAACTVYLPKPSRRGFPVTQYEIWERREVSKDCLDRLLLKRDHLLGMAPALFSDALLRLAGAMATYEEEYGGGPPYVLGHILTKVKDVINFIFMWLVKHDNATFLALVGNIQRKRKENEGPMEYGEQLYKKMFGESSEKTRRIFPSLRERKKFGMQNLHALILFLAASTTERKSLMYLEDCVKKDWIVQIGEGKLPAGCGEGEELHPGTFIEHGNKKAWYQTKLYAVR
jgi:hypothetical protein